MPDRVDQSIAVCLSSDILLVLKRIIDFLAATLLIVASAPLMTLLVIAVKLSSPGPALFAHKRVGKDRRVFLCKKLRTMVVDAEEWLDRDPELKAKHRENGFKLPSRSDPRVTRLGAFLRYTHLDELPQLLNVMTGDMSLVGPRPVVEEELDWYGDATDELLSVRPGVFGPWTSQGKNRVDYPERVEVELGYIRDRSFGKDLRLILKNVPVLLTGQTEE